MKYTITWFAIAIAIIAMVISGWNETPYMLYPNCGQVMSVNADSDTVVFEDGSGNQWEFVGAEDWETGDIVAVIMNDNGTDEIKDDIVVQCKYCG